MGLKTPLVYGELSALFGEIRRRVELDVNTGKPHRYVASAFITLHSPSRMSRLKC